MLQTVYVFALLHVGFIVVGIASLYLGGSVVSYVGPLDQTPIGGFFSDDYEALSVNDPLDFVGLFGFIRALGDLVSTLTVFNYDIMTAPTQDDGWPFWVGLLFQGVGIVGTVSLGFQIWKEITSSGILNSNWGAAVVLLGVSTTAALGGIGLLFG